MVDHDPPAAMSHIERANKVNQEVEQVILRIQSEPEQIDEIARLRNWFRPEDGSFFLSTINAYLDDAIDVQEAVSRIATPIDHTYTTADNGHALLEAEEAAANQRQFWSPEEAELYWGTALPQSELPTVNPDEAHLTTEGQSWQLWYCILHSAKRRRWREAGVVHDKLIELVRALKARPDPPPPKPMTKALKNDWIWQPGALWSWLLMLGPSVRESWNDGPGGGAGYSVPERHMWENVNAFVARITAEGLSDFSLYGTWAMNAMIEDDPDQANAQHKASVTTRLDTLLPVACAWILVLGKHMWENDRKSKDTNDNAESPRHWESWRSKLNSIRSREDLGPGTREIVAEALEKMHEIDRQISD